MKNLTFTIRPEGLDPVQITGLGFEHCGIQLVVHGALERKPPFQPNREYGYEVSEPLTGLNISRYSKTQNAAIKAAKDKLDQFGIERTKLLIQQTIERSK